MSLYLLKSQHYAKLTLWSGLVDSLEVHDHWWGSPHEEPPLQANPDSQHVLYIQQSIAADRHAAAEQVAGVVGLAQLLAAIYFPRL